MDDLAALARVSAELGANRLLIQAAGGNTSVKSDGVLWVKASGRWLAKALDEPIFAALDLPRLTEAMARRRSGLRDLRRVLARRSLRSRPASLGRDDAARRPAAALRSPCALRRDDLQRGSRRRRGSRRAVARRAQMAMGSLYASRLSVVPDDHAGRRRLCFRQSRPGGRRRHGRGGRRLACNRRAKAGAPASDRSDPARPRRRTRRLSLRQRARADAARGEVRRRRLALSRPCGVPRQRRGAHRQRRRFAAGDSRPRVPAAGAARIWPRRRSPWPSASATSRRGSRRTIGRATSRRSKSTNSPIGTRRSIVTRCPARNDPRARRRRRRPGAPRTASRVRRMRVSPRR